MSGNDLEREVIRMGDVGVAIDMVDNNLAEGKLEQAERAVVILREILQPVMMGCGTASTEVSGMRDNCVIFTTPERQELRVSSTRTEPRSSAGRTSRQSRAMNSREKPSPAAIRA